MTVNSLTNSAEFATDGINRLFPFYFKFLDKKDLVVAFVNSAGVGTTLTLNVDYTVSGEGSEGGGQVTTTVAPAALGRLVVAREMEATQKTALRNQGRFFAEVHETVFDRLTMLLQQAMALAGRALRTSTLEPGGIDPLPLEARRADKLLAFDAGGQPAASNLTLAQLEQQPALAMEAAEAAVAAANASEVSAGNSAASAISANASKNAAAGSATAAAASAKSAADAGIQLGMSSWGYRAQPFKGFALEDGQELERALYPDFVAALDAGWFPTTTEALWQGFAEQRGRFVANSSPGKFRMRDTNGAQPGGFGPAFQRGSPIPNGGFMRLDQMQGHTHNFTNYVATGGGLASSAATATNPLVNTVSNPVSDGVNGTPRTGSETFPTHVVGAWMTRLYGMITPLGVAEASSLATAYASMAARMSTVESKVFQLERQRFWHKYDLGQGRVMNVPYTNNTGMELFLHCSFVATTAQDRAHLIINGIDFYGTTLGASGLSTSISGIVPPGGVYQLRLSGPGSASAVGWSEYSL